MMNATLYRWKRDQQVTLGVLRVGDFACHTIELTWIDDGTVGGKNGDSCIPPGSYELEPHTRPNGDTVYALVNEELGVYRYEEDVPGATREEREQNGRWLVLIHVANFGKDIRGCIGPGMTQQRHPEHGEMVGSSAAATREVMARLDAHVFNTLEITEGLAA